MDEVLVANFDENGMVEIKDGKIVVSGIAPDDVVAGKWGGLRQRGRVVMKLYLKAQTSTDLSPDMGK